MTGSTAVRGVDDECTATDGEGAKRDRFADMSGRCRSFLIVWSDISTGSLIDVNLGWLS